MLNKFKSLFEQSKSTGKSTTPWPFDQPPDCAVITTIHVMKKGADITHIFHDLDDHGWQFLPPSEMSEEDVMLVSLKQIVEHDSSVLEVADIPPGWSASRSHRKAPWTRHKNG